MTPTIAPVDTHTWKVYLFRDPEQHTGASFVVCVDCGIPYHGDPKDDPDCDEYPVCEGAKDGNT